MLIGARVISCGVFNLIWSRLRRFATASWTVAVATEVVNTYYTAGGGMALYDSSPLQRHLRDIHTLTRHITVADGWFTRAGAILLGKDPGFGVA
jgi:indole-3-acetate monooxygenase